MKIVMLGHTGVGKTTYMASLYGVLQESIGGFSLKAVNRGDRDRLLDLAKQIARGKYPLSTDQRSEYDFYLQYQAKNVLNFSWADYRGGAIRESKNSEEASLLIQDLRQAEGIMMFCDCDALVRGDIRSNQIGRMTTLVNHALQDLSHPLSLAIVFTKSDLVPRFDENLLKYFGGLIGTIEASKLISGSLIPIACGTELINVPLPLLFVLYTAVTAQALSMSVQAEQHQANAQDLEAKNKGVLGVFRLVKDSWSGKQTTTELAAIEKQKAIQTAREYEFIRKPATALNRYVQQLPLIQPGTSLTEYVDKLSQIKISRTFTQRTSNSTYQIYSDPFDAF